MGEQIKVVCVGDSITEGFGLAEKEAYPFVLQSIISDRYIVFNKGVSGSCVTDALLGDEIVGMPYVRQERYKEAVDLCGDIYIVMLGTNDGQDGMHDFLDQQDMRNDIISYRADFIKNYMKIINSILQKNPDAVIYIVRPIPVLQCIWRKHQQKYMDMLLPLLDQIVEEHEKFRMIDLFGRFQMTYDKLQDLYLDDGLHPNAAGARLIAKVIGHAITADQSSKE